MSKRSVPDMLLGLIVVLAFAGLLLLALKAANLTSFGGGETYQISAQFDNIGGLKTRAAVRSSGVLVGRVTSISLEPRTYRAVVQMSIQRSLVLPRDTSAKIQTAGLLGDQYIGLEAGGDKEPLNPGDAIAITKSAYVMEQIIGQALFGKPAEAGERATPGGSRSP